MEHKKKYKCPHCGSDKKLSKILGAVGDFLKLADQDTGGKIWKAEMEVCVGCGAFYVSDLYVNTDKLEPKKE